MPRTCTENARTFSEAGEHDRVHSGNHAVTLAVPGLRGQHRGLLHFDD